MIVISSQENDLSTNDVEEWLHYFQNSYNVRRLDDEQVIKSLSIKIQNKKNSTFKYKCNNKNINSSNITAYWYRRGMDIIDNKLFELATSNCNQPILNYIFEENRCIQDTLDTLKEHIKVSIGNFKHNRTNKISNLFEASKCGLLIPDTLVTNEKKEVLKFIKTYKSVIVKNIAQSPFIQATIGKNKILNISFENFLLNEENFGKILDESFGLTLFQRYINKKFELRVFFLNNTFYTTSIFSQANEKTKIDYRNYNPERPNRTIPFDLPSSLKRKIKNLMEKLGMNCGSIDLIYSTDSRFYFLEVNPIGQFKGNEKRCNFYISRHIALTLFKNKANYEEQ